MSATYVDGLRAARASVVKQERALQASPVLPFSKYKFFLANLKAYLSVYILGAYPQFFTLYCAVQFAVFVPVQAYRWHKLKWLAYFTEFCWISNAFLCVYVWTLYLAPELVPERTREVATLLYVAVGAGPLGCAVIALGNALVPHSIDHMMSLLIHLQAALAAYTLRWDPHVDRALFPLATDVGLLEYVTPPLAVLFGWALLHAAFMLACHASLKAAGHTTVFDDNMKLAHFRRLAGTGSDRVVFVKYEVLSCLMNAFSIFCTYPLYRYGTRRIHFCIIFATASMACWNGAGWYTYRFSKFSKEIDRLIEQADKTK